MLIYCQYSIKTLVYPDTYSVELKQGTQNDIENLWR